MRIFENGIVILALCAGLAACSGGSGEVPAIGAADMVLGKADAPIEVIEYASTACSHCAEFALDVFPAFKAKYIDSGQARYSVRELTNGPTAAIPYATAGFLLARCAGKDKYFDVLDAVYRGQKSWTNPGSFRQILLDIGLSTGMTEPQFTACVGDSKSVEAFNKRVEKNGADSKHQGTPIFYVGGKQRFPNGLPTLEALDKAIAEAKAEKK